MSRIKPSITGTRHLLPFDQLSPLDFERLCLWLVQREGFERAEHLGSPQQRTGAGGCHPVLHRAQHKLGWGRPAAAGVPKMLAANRQGLGQ